MSRKMTAAAVALSLVASSTMASEFVPSEIVQLCTQRWGTDYVMKEFCINNQLEAMRRLDESGALYSTQRTSTEKAKSKPKVGDYICKGGVPCEHSDVE